MMNILKGATFADEEGVMYADNDERAIFFAKELLRREKIELGSRYHSCAWLDGICYQYT
jgi:hypothetical protein